MRRLPINLFVITVRRFTAVSKAVPEFRTAVSDRVTPSSLVLIRRAPAAACHHRASPQHQQTTSHIPGHDSRDFFEPVEFGEVKYVSEIGDLNRNLIIDVRTPDEFTQGRIPKAVNIPLDDLAESLGKGEDDFKEQFGFEAPRKDQNIIIYCLAGVRAHQAAKIMRSFGYGDIRVYYGSWNDWSANNGTMEK